MLIKLVRLKFESRQSIRRAAEHRAKDKEELKNAYKWAREKLSDARIKVMQEIVLSFKVNKVTEEVEKRVEEILEELKEKLVEIKGASKEKSSFFVFKHTAETDDKHINLHFHIWADIRDKQRVLLKADELRKIQLEMYKKYDPEMYEKLAKVPPGAGKKEKKTPIWILQLKKENKKLRQENEEIKEKAKKVLEYARKLEELLEKEKEFLKKEAMFELQIEELEKQLEHIEKAIKQKEKELKNAKKSFLKRILILGQAKELETELMRLKKKEETIKSNIESATIRLKELRLKKKELLSTEKQGFSARPMQQAPSTKAAPSTISPERAYKHKQKLKLKN